MKFPSIPLRPKTPMLVAAMLLGVAAPAFGATSVPAGPALPDFVMTSEAAPERMHLAQSQEAAQLAVRIQQLEEQIRSLNGQIEGLTFQLTQMQTLIERMTEDNEFRFTQLEGGAGGKTDAATQPGGVTQPEALPQTTTPTDTTVAPTIIPEQGVRPLPGEAEFDPTFDDGSVAPTDTIGNSGDPLLGTGQGAVGADLGTGQPLDLTYTPGTTGSGGNPDADAQFKAGYDALVAGDFAFAEDQFSQFIALYPDDPQAGDAANWLGEALIQRSAYDEAAEVLLTAFQKAPESPRAPDLLLKLGVSLAGAQERETACRTFGEIDKRYPNLPAAFLTKLGEEKARAECPPA